MSKKKLDDELDKIFESVVFESRVPKVGIWWKWKDSIISFTSEIRDVKEVNGFRDSEYNHFEEWDKLGLPGDYTSIPRGRVIQSLKDDKFIVYVPSILQKDRNFLLEIFREFSLPTSKIKILTDPHYEDIGNDPFEDYDDD